MAVKPKKDEDFNPAKNHSVISIAQEPDGNWKGYAWKFGKLVEVREAKPEDALIKLLTHSGD